MRFFRRDVAPVDLASDRQASDQHRVLRFLRLLEASSRFADEGDAMDRRRSGRPPSRAISATATLHEAVDALGRGMLDEARDHYYQARAVLLLVEARRAQMLAMLNEYWRVAADSTKAERQIAQLNLDADTFALLALIDEGDA